MAYSPQAAKGGMSGPHIGSNGMLSGHSRPRGSVGPMLPEIRLSDHEQMKVLLRPVLAKFCENLCAGVEKNERTAMNMFPRIMGAIGAEVEVNVNLACVSAFGIEAEDVRQIIEAHQASSATTIEQCSEDGIALLQWVLTQEPERRAAVLAALGGEGADTEVPRLEAPGPNGHA